MFTVEVPDIAPGEYWVVLTNQVPEHRDPMQAVSGEYIYRKERFTVIQGTRSATIYTIQPNRGPEGTISTITGRYLGSLNIDGLEIHGDYQKPEESISGDGVLTLRYSGNDSEQVIIGKYREADVKSVEKTIKVIIGPQASIQDSSFYRKWIGFKLESMTTLMKAIP